MTVDIVIPLYNKEKNILNYYNKINEELNKIKHNFIFVDNASTDKTMDVIKDLYQKDDERIKIISLSKNHDKQTAILAGLSNCSSPLVCIFDLDGQVNVSYITKMFDYLIEHQNYDSVCLYSNYKEKNILKKGRISIINKMFNLNIDVNKTYYRLMKKSVVDAILKLSKKEFSLYLFELIGFKTYYIKFDNKNHLEDIDIKKMITYSQKPFKFIKLINYFLILVFVILLILKLFNKLNIGNNTIFFTIMIMSIIEIYLLRWTSCFLYKKNKKTNYFIKEKIGFDDNIL